MITESPSDDKENNHIDVIMDNPGGQNNKVNSNDIPANKRQLINRSNLIDVDDEGIDQVVSHNNEIEVDDDAEIVVDADPEEVEDDSDDEDDDDDSDESEEIIEIDNPNSTNPAKRPLTNQLPHANEFKALSKRLMKTLPDYPVKDENHFVWEIEDWAGLKEDKVRSPTFTCGGFSWNILLFPKGNGNNLISIYMEPHPLEDQPVNDDWYVCAQFALDIWNPVHPEAHIASGSSHRFNKNETDWGFSAFVDLKQMSSIQRNHQHPMLENNKINITGYVKVIDDSSTGVLWHSFLDYDSKKNTGYVGLNNQGATCYLNSLLQSYFTTKSFRKLVYQIPTEDTATNKNIAVPLALQRIFYQLSTSDDPVGTLELTKSFGWDSSDAFTQHDVQELNRILMDKLETAMKGTQIENKLNDIFVGKMKSYIKCVDVPYESSRVEDFWDIQLNVKGFKNLAQSFKNYIEIEMLDGENKYQAGDEYGYQDAKKGVVFESFPPVLHLQLKRFEYDFMVDDLVKIDDFYEFPDKIDLKPYLDEDLSDDIKQQNWNYKLHGVLVHQGSISNGHYYAMIKPNAKDSTWLRFDDDKVWKATNTQVFHENFGANELSSDVLARMSRVEQNEYLIRRATSAYMLVYYRESDLEQVLPADDSSIDSSLPAHVPKQIQEEKDRLEQLERYRQEALFFINVKIVTASNFSHFNGFDIFPDPTVAKFYDQKIFDQRAYPVVLKVKKDDKLSALYEAVAQELGISKQDEVENGDDQDVLLELDKYPFRLVLVSHRNNHTNRSETPVPLEHANLTISQIYAKCSNKKYDEMVFYVEEPSKDLASVNELSQSSIKSSPETVVFEDISKKINESQFPTGSKKAHEFKSIYEGSSHYQIFLKYFDIVTNEVRGLTHVIVPKDATITSLIKPVNRLLGFSEDTPLEVFEEFSHVKVENVEVDLTFEKNELSNGDILVFQIADVENATLDNFISNIKDYYRFLLTRLHINVKPYKADHEDEDSDFVAEDDDDVMEVQGTEDDAIEVLSADGKHHDKPVESVQEAKDIEMAKEISKSFDIWISTQHSYKELAQELAKKIGNNVDPEYLRIFILNNQGVRYPLKSTQSLSQFFPKLVSVSTVTNFEYEILNITLKEYENMKSIKLYWLNSLLQFQLFDLLMPKTSTANELINKLIHKLNIPEKQRNDILLWAGLEHKYVDLIKFDRTIDTINDHYELYAGYFPAEVEILAHHDLFKRFGNEPTDPNNIEDEFIREDFLNAQRLTGSLNIIPVFHFYRNTNYQHGIPFIFPVYPDEAFEATKERLRKKLGLGIQAFEKVKLALADSSGKGLYLDNSNTKLNLFDEVANFDANVSLALDHPGRSPRRQNPYDKGISIK